jgi:4-amino-4-deoxy-L-arabinose transferase-like glycosyltransferase
MKSAISAIFLLIVVVILFAAPVTRMFYRFSITYNEGWTVYHSDTASKGKQIYDNDPFTPVVYPPLFFYLEGLIGKLFGNFLMIGRILSLLGLIATAIFAALIVRMISNNRFGSIFAAIFFCGAVAAIAPQYVAMNDAQLPAHVLSAAALLVYLKAVRTNSSLWPAALLVTAALFTKHNLIAVPAAITIDLLFRSRRDFSKWILFVSIFVATFTILTFLFAGPGFFDQVFAGRYISIQKMLTQTRQFATFSLIPLVASIIWCIKNPQYRILILWLFLSILIGIITASGFGTAMNMFFDAFLCMSVILGILISNLKPLPQALLPVILFLSIEVAAISELQTLLGKNLTARFEKQQAEFVSDVQFLKNQQANVVCGNPLLCFDAGKRLDFDPFNVSQRIMIGKMQEQDAVKLFESGHFKIVQIKEQHYEENSSRNAKPEMFADTFFTQNMISAIRMNYKVERKTPTGNFYVLSRHK